MKIRLKTDHSVTRDADPIEEARIGNWDPYGWSSIDRENQTQILYPITRWERAPIERWASQPVQVVNGGRAVRLVLPSDRSPFAIGRLVQWEIPDNMRAVQHSASCIVFQRRLGE